MCSLHWKDRIRIKVGHINLVIDLFYFVKVSKNIIYLILFVKRIQINANNLATEKAIEYVLNIFIKIKNSCFYRLAI